MNPKKPERAFSESEAWGVALPTMLVVFFVSAALVLGGVDKILVATLFVLFEVAAGVILFL